MIKFWWRIKIRMMILNKKMIRLRIKKKMKIKKKLQLKTKTIIRIFIIKPIKLTLQKNITRQVKNLLIKIATIIRKKNK